MSVDPGRCLSKILGVAFEEGESAFEEREGRGKIVAGKSHLGLDSLARASGLTFRCLHTSPRDTRGLAREALQEIFILSVLERERELL